MASHLFDKDCFEDHDGNLPTVFHSQGSFVMPHSLQLLQGAAYNTGGIYVNLYAQIIFELQNLVNSDEPI